MNKDILKNKFLIAICSSALTLGTIALPSYGAPLPTKDFEEDAKTWGWQDDAINKLLDRLRTGESFNLAVINDIANSNLNNSMDDLQNRFLTLNNKFDTIAAGEDCQWGTQGAQYGAWGSGVFNHGKQKKRSEIPGYKLKSYGGTLGVDTLISEGNTIGLAGTILKSKVTLKDQKSGDSNNINSYILSLYAKQDYSNFFLQEIVSAAHHKNKNTEKRLDAVNVDGDEFEKAKAKYNSKSYSAQVLAGYDASNETVIITPTIGVRFTHNKNKAYTEKGEGVQNLKVNIKQKHTLEGILGLKIATVACLDCGFSVIPDIHGSIYHNFKNKSYKITREFVENPDNYTLPERTVKPHKTHYKVGLGINLSKDNTQYGLNYDATIAKKYLGHQGSLRVRINF